MLPIIIAALLVAPPLRPPAYPLVTCDPYFSTWSMTDTLTDSWPRHWSGGTTGMCGMIRVDGKPFRWAGMMPEVAVAEQKSVDITTTATTYAFSAGPVDFTVSFISPVLAEDLAAASRSVAFIDVTTNSTDGRPHDVQFYVDFAGEWTVHDPGTSITWSRHRIAGHEAVSIGSVNQPVLATAGDQRKIDWGRLFVVAPKGHAAAAAGHNASREAFVRSGGVIETDDLRAPRAANDDWPVLATAIDLGGSTGASTSVMLAYDDRFSIELFDRRLRPLWNLDGRGVERAVTAGFSGSAGSRDRGGVMTSRLDDRYDALTTLAYRQVMAGHKIVADWDGTPLMFSKENTSNGCIATVDVIYPASPFFLYHSPEMLKAQLRPLLMYAASNRWKFPFAPHDLGTYPKANGQVYGGGERTEENQMPVEESGNMLIMLAALAKVEGNAEFSRPYEAILEKWAAYLDEHGLDPAHQLCTDDFAGHLARNANLSAKTVVAMGAYAQLLESLGHADRAAAWMEKARAGAARWEELAADGESTVLAFGTTRTWSQKYNLIWDRVLGLGLFPQSTFDREMKVYLSRMQKYGLPLDSRRTYTKLDWTCWSACLTGRASDFDAVMGSVYAWVNETPSRVPLSDWYETTDGRTMGMHTRTVVGGLWMPLLMEKMGVGLR
ncbi:MAG: hypothetical protein AMXMBFR58_07440 [Phycisphaerae bacterium]